MKVVVNAFSARLGGGQTYLRNLFAHLPDDPGLDVQVFAADDLALPPDPRVRRVHTAWPTTNPLLRAVWEKLALPRWLAKQRADVLFCPGGVVATRPPRGVKVVSMFRNMIPFDARVMAAMPWGPQRLRNLILRRVLLRSLAEADLSIFISDYAHACIERRRHIANAVTIPHGIAAAFRTAGGEVERPAAAPAGRYLLYVSRFDIYKHHAEVVQAYARLDAAVRERHPLLLLGENDLPSASRVRALVRSLGLQGQVQMPGAVPYADLPAYYHHAHAIVFASSCENCPNILLEALGAGRPVLCSDVMPMPEFGGDGLLYFSPYDSASLHAALHKVIADEALSRQVAAAALERSRQYDWAVTARRTWARILALGTASGSASARARDDGTAVVHGGS
ncbi:MAG: glycosyltransferase family 4 protein [Burkholderiales bacterium]|nr:glycosyltransferase family 4 protein [Burkholderiales bacterium]